MIKFKVRGWWRAAEAAGAASALLSRHAVGNEFLNPPWSIQVKAQTEDGVVRILADDLTEEQIGILRDYFENHPEQDMPEWEQAELTARAARVARIRKVTDDTGITLKTADLKDAIRALAERTGVEL